MTESYSDQVFVMAYRKFYRPLSQFLYKYVGNTEMIKDIIHETFLAIYEKKILLEPVSKNLFTFLCTASKNRALDHMKRIKRENDKYHEILYEEINLEKNFYHDVEEFYIEGEVLSTLYDVLDGLSERERFLFIHRVMEQKPIYGIAAETGETIYQVKKTIRKVSHQIRDRLEHFYDHDS